MASLVGSTFGNYIVDQRLGAGGMGEVYRAHHRKLPWQVCIKIIRPDRSDEEGFTLFAALFEREAQVLATLTHPNIVLLRDFGTRQEDELAYLVMDFVEGGDLAGILRRAGGPLPLNQVDAFLTQIAAGLDYAHSKTILHRDLKPQNILRHSDGRLVIADFGLAKAVQTALASSHLSKTISAGTPAYMAPEHCQGAPELRSDLYALGVMAYEMLAGRLPFQGEPMQVMFAHVTQTPPPIQQWTPVAPAVEAVVLKMLAKDPQARYQSATAFTQALREAIQQAMTLPSPPGLSEPSALQESSLLTTTPAASEGTQPVVPPSLLANVSTPLSPLFNGLPAEKEIEQAVAPSSTFSLQSTTPGDVPTRFSSEPAGATPALFSSQGNSPAKPSVSTPRLPSPTRFSWRKPYIWGSAIIATVVILTAVMFASRLQFTTHQVSTTPLTLTGHTGHVRSVAINSDNRTLASGSDDATIKVWDATSGKELSTLSGHESTVYSVTFSPDGSILASGSGDKTIKLWDVASGKKLRTLEGHTRQIDSVAFSPDGQFLVSSSEDGTIKGWDVQSGKLLRTLSGGAYSLAFSPDGRTLAAGLDDGTIKLWDIAGGQDPRSFAAHDSVFSVAFSPDGRTLASGLFSGTIKLWDVNSGNLLRTLTGHTKKVNSVAFSPDGHTLVSGGWDGTIRLWDVSSGKELQTLSDHAEFVNAVVFSQDGHILVSAEDSTVKVWKVS